ncbi:MAG: PRC-barrel domain-containing protein [Ktedonobacterales bacterium]
MNAKELKGYSVVSLKEGNQVGAVDDVLFDGQFRTVLGFRLEHVEHYATPVVVRSHVAAIGHDAITVSSLDDIMDLAQHPELQTAVDLDQITGTKVVSDKGEELGTIDDVELDDAAQTARAYLLSRSLLERIGQQHHNILVDRVIQVGTGGLMTVTSPTITS